MSPGIVVGEERGDRKRTNVRMKVTDPEDAQTESPHESEGHMGVQGLTTFSSRVSLFVSSIVSLLNSILIFLHVSLFVSFLLIS